MNILMKTLPVVTIVLMACASNKVDLLAPKVELEQLSGESELYLIRGPVSVRYEVRVLNPSSEPVTLRQLDLRTFGDSPYVLRQGPQFLKKTVPPGEYVTFELGVYGSVVRTGAGTNEPVIIRGIATFETNVGTRQMIFTQTLTQSRTSDRD